MSKEVILTGIRSNSEPTLGNYLGAFLPMVELQKKHAGEHQLNMFVPDLHSFTTPIEHENLYENTIRNLKYFVSAGLDIKNGVSDIDKAGADLNKKIERSVTVGLFNYPALMAADILLYGAKWVPVGEDQRQHLEYTRDLAIRMNNKFGDIFVVPEDNAKQTEFAERSEPVRIRSLRNPEKKMSKSVQDPAGTILLNDSPADAAQKVMSATTDSENAIHWDWEKQPGVTNLLQILSLLTNKSKDEVTTEWEGKSSYGELKTTVAEAVKNFLIDFQQKLSEVNQDQLLQKLEADEAEMSTVANTTLGRVQQAIGLRPKL
jgi:tryptophanyl-tRNA synthetase